MGCSLRRSRPQHQPHVRSARVLSHARWISACKRGQLTGHVCSTRSRRKHAMLSCVNRCDAGAHFAKGRSATNLPPCSSKSMLVLASSEAASVAAEFEFHHMSRHSRDSFPSSLPIASRKSAPGFGACRGGGGGLRGRGGGGSIESGIGKSRSASLSCFPPQLVVASQVPSCFLFSMIDSARSVYVSIILLHAWWFQCRANKTSKQEVTFQCLKSCAEYRGCISRGGSTEPLLPPVHAPPHHCKQMVNSASSLVRTCGRTVSLISV